jgi:hypothetical protein
MSSNTCRFLLAALSAAAFVSGLGVSPASADDRSLVKESESEPYVMVILDVTGSMNRIPSAEQYATLRQDDPASRLYQAKEALYEVLGDRRMENIHFGFATFPNRDFLRARSKGCNPNSNGDNGDCISGNEREDVCSQSDNPGTCTQVPPATCRGWEPNGDADDLYRGKNFNQTTTANPNDGGYPAVMQYGDVIPMDWQSAADRAAGESSDNRRRIRERLAPNLIGNPNAMPNFGVASYFNNSTSNGSLNFVNSSRRPIIAHGGTPLARTLDDFRAHYALWEAQAEQHDPQFGCKQVHVILITDGLDTCESFSDRPTRPPAAAAAIYDGGNGPSVWVIGYSTGINSGGRAVINNIADSGGTFSCPIINNCTEGTPGCCDSGTVDHAFFPTTKEELIDAIAGIGSKIRGDARSFAAAAVPQGQANVSDKIYLASFFPLEDSPLWPGALDSYLRPLPLRTITIPLPGGGTEERQVPDRGVECTADSVSKCRIWDAADELLEQAPTADQILARQYNFGLAADERRVYYSVEAATPGTVPAVRKPFVPDVLPSDDAGALMGLMGCGSFQSCSGTDNAAVDELHEVLAWALAEKQYEVPSPDPDPSDGFSPGQMKPFLLGEIFHSDPAVIGSPEAFRYYVDDLESDRNTKQLLGQGYDAACGDRGEGENPGYVCFFERHRYRRKLVFAGSNDGQLHVFDGGIFRGELDDETGVVTGEFDDGTGGELFSFIPRGVMPMLVQQSRGAIELYGVDGKVQAADVYIDAGAGEEWRTVVLGSLREGGVGYFALDVTQPDQLPDLEDDDTVPVPTAGSYVPSCIDGGANCSGEYPKVLWEFFDRCEVGGVEGPCDEDLPSGNGLPDLADGWSRPATGVVEVCANSSDPCTSFERKFVAVFGGGMDPDNPIAAGNHLFIVDIETGKPIYKRALTGAVPSEPASVDTDQDGILDTIYVGTTAGLMYKVSLGGTPSLTAGRVAPGDWDPFPIFNVNTAGEPVRPFFYPPSVIFVTERGRYALAFGTGYREDLWATVGQTARFVLILDEFRDTSVTPPRVRPFEHGDYLAGELPLNVSDLPAAIDTESEVVNDANLLQSGWWMELQAEERLIASPFALSGLLVFLTFQPDEVIGGGGGFCANAGIGRSFTVQTVNGSTLRGGRKPYTIIPDLPTSPFTEVGVTKNPNPTEEGESEGIPDEMLSVMEALKRLFPRECRFGNYSINVKSRRADTGIEWIAPVPICIVQKNWKGL